MIEHPFLSWHNLEKNKIDPLQMLTTVRELLSHSLKKPIFTI